MPMAEKRDRKECSGRVPGRKKISFFLRGGKGGELPRSNPLYPVVSRLSKEEEGSAF